ncbi:MAG: sporulation integral membrane protein YtvI [Ruminococcus sp.]|nr:sporulation integral membrane protein YtvI [Ruminococcus sp.]
MKEVEKRRNTLINVLYFAMILAIVVVLLRYAVSICLPFIIAFIVAAILQKPKNFLVSKTPLKKGAASGICVLLTIFIVVALIALIGVRVSTEIKGFIDYIMIQLQDMDKVVDNVESWLMNLISSLPEFLRKTLNESATQMFAQLRDSISGNSDELASQITSGIGGKFSLSWITTPISGVISTAKQLPSVFVAVIISLVACCFMTSEFPEIINFFKLQFPENRRKDLSRAKVILKDSLGKMAKAYALIILVTFIEMSIGLTILKLIHVFDSSYIILIAAATAIVDILPVLGTGTVLVPWAIYSFIMGNVGMGIGLIVIYAAISIIRQVIEPKLVAGQLGLSPIVTIAALYFGLKLFGVLGMFITPLLVIMLKLLNDEGIVKLWKSPARVKAEAEAAQAEKAENASDEK